MLKYCQVLLITVSVFFSKVTLGFQIEDVEIPLTVQLPGVIRSLQLQGAGVRSKFFVNVYVGAFYSEENISSREAALKNTGAKRMQMSFLHYVSHKKFRDSWQEGFKKNNDEEKLKKFSKEIQQFISFFSESIQEGDDIYIDLLPEKGVHVIVNGKQKGLIENVLFYPVVLSTWMGEKPPSYSFQKDLLGRKQ